MNRNFENRKSTKSRITSRENKAIIKALNMYGRVPEQWELLEEIERLNNIINDIKDYVSFLVIFNQTIDGKFSETQWGQDLLDLIGSDKE